MSDINGPVGVSTDGGNIIFRTDDLTYVIGTDGQNRGFYDRHTGTNHLYAASPSSFLQVFQGSDSSYDSTAITLQGSDLSVVFGSSGVSGKVRVHVQPGYLTLELLSVSEPGVTSVTLANLRLNLTQTVGYTLAHCEGTHYAAAVVSLNIFTRSVPTNNTSWSLLWAEADSRVRLVGAKIAILGCKPFHLLHRLSQIEKENGLPHPTLDNVWARESDEVKSSYLFVDLNRCNVDEMVAYAKRGGFRYIVIYDSWTSSHGTYPVSSGPLSPFPNGDVDLQAVSSIVQSQGLKLGMHVLHGVVDKHDQLVTPVVQPGFFMVPGVTRTLKGDIAPNQNLSFIETPTSPAPTAPNLQDGFLAAGVILPKGAETSDLRGYSLRIDDERIFYTDIQTSPPYGFTVDPACIKVAHSAGALIENFAEFTFAAGYYPLYYLPDLTGPLWEQMTATIAQKIKQFGFEFIYPDGYGENLFVQLPVEQVPRWYLANLLITKLYSAVQSVQCPLLFAHEPLTNDNFPDVFTDYPWHVLSRTNTIDQLRNVPPFPSPTNPVNSQTVINFVRDYSLPGDLRFRAESDLEPFEFGWFGLSIQTPPPPYTQTLPYIDATRPREIEYVWSKALAYGASMSLETTQAELEGNGRTDEILDLIGVWEKLRLTDYFPQSIREQMKAAATEFTLRPKHNNQWEVRPITYDEHQVDPLVSGSDHWTLPNPYSADHVRIVIEAGLGNVTNPGLRVNNAPSIQFQINLPVSCYLEYTTESGLRVFDGNGHGVTQTGNVVSGGPVLLQPGDNDIVFFCDEGQAANAKVTLATMGPPL